MDSATVKHNDPNIQKPKPITLEDLLNPSITLQEGNMNFQIKKKMIEQIKKMNQQNLNSPEKEVIGSAKGR